MSYLDLDFKTPNKNNGKAPSSAFKNTHKSPLNSKTKVFIALFVAMSLTTISIIFYMGRQPAPVESQDRLITPAKIPQKIIEPLLHKNIEKKLKSTLVTIKNGDTLSTIFDQQGLPNSLLYKLMSDSEHGNVLKSIKAKQTLEFSIGEDKQLLQLTYQPNITQTITYARNQSNDFYSQIINNPLEAIPTYRSGTIESSLFLAAAANDIPETVIMNLVSIFGWDIDFALDIRKGDAFQLIYNEMYQDGEKVKSGRILAAEFTNQNKTYQAIFFEDENGDGNYYSPDGKSMRKAFLRNPVKFSRISSGFTNRRWHPVLSKWRSHKGVDYAAPKGTPIYAAGDGKVIHAANKGGYGRTVIIKHGGKYTTLYAHLNSFNQKARQGRYVKQGQVIGYVGSSGLATGPHLHYEFRVSGVHRNPLTVKLPAANPINKKYASAFNKERLKLLNMMKLMSKNQDE